MKPKRLDLILPPAPKGSKRDWIGVSAQLPPETHERLLRLAEKEVKRRTDLVREAIEELLDRKAA
jgi:predicted DNA-binding protein